MQDAVLVQHWVVELHQAQAMQAETVDQQELSALVSLLFLRQEVVHV
jgi:hypothetical protein